MSDITGTIFLFDDADESLKFSEKNTQQRIRTEFSFVPFVMRQMYFLWTNIVLLTE